ncbi:Hypothetical Protein FCC1311_024872 [Hondaea fermentalgiana]|uniref:HIG1 domain-containing protein n=1 Tax=Hondaea fermentalgiana TaxID=2315210 RepID=A0A2R5G5F9_9STRA|nr:Hypothetical Protein FCC1311_024872 [Hondaea fermentalgiana]|eukprot:GBG26266.1 Hypothetical Protein FCC1311_024872 [Hondaea fermentalgiana]
MRGDGIFESQIAADAIKNLTPAERKKNVEWISLKAGMKTFGIAGAISVPTTLALLKFSPWFRKSTGVSGRVATAFIPPVFAFAFVSEQTASRLAHPEAYESYVSANPNAHMPLSERVMNMVDKNPVGFLAAVGVPVVGGIFIAKGRDPSLTLSQRIMHTRVMGQASVLAILSGVALYHAFNDEPHRH